MKKDIIIPQVINVHIAAVQQWNEDFQENSWYAHLINNTSETLEMALVVSRAYGIINGEERKTGTFRHAIASVAPFSSAQIELLENNVLQLHNEFAVTYFCHNQLFEKTYTFAANSITKEAVMALPVMPEKGILLS